MMHGMQGVLFANAPGYVPCPAPTFVDLARETGNYNTIVEFFMTNALLQQELARIGPASKYSSKNVLGHFDSGRVGVALTNSNSFSSNLWTR